MYGGTSWGPSSSPRSAPSPLAMLDAIQGVQMWLDWIKAFISVRSATIHWGLIKFVTSKWSGNVCQGKHVGKLIHSAKALEGDNAVWIFHDTDTKRRATAPSSMRVLLSLWEKGLSWKDSGVQVKASFSSLSPYSSYCLVGPATPEQRNPSWETASHG